MAGGWLEWPEKDGIYWFVTTEDEVPIPELVEVFEDTNGAGRCVENLVTGGQSLLEERSIYERGKSRWMRVDDAMPPLPPEMEKKR
jgi:hypothetical protein